MNTSTIIGITGGIGSGKSVVSRILRLQGRQVYDCDMEARRIMEQDTALRAQLTALIGPQAYCSDGTLDRQFMASRIFAEDVLRCEVNRAVHSAVRKDILRRVKAGDVFPLFVESAILATSGLAPLCSEIWVVEAEETLRVTRTMRRSGLTASQVQARMRSQQEEWQAMKRLEAEGKRLVRIPNDDCCSLLARIAAIEENTN